MTEMEMKALMLLAGFKVLRFAPQVNGYWPDHPNYDVQRRQSPWWRVTTPHGEITIGDRKNVCQISWAMQKIVTAEEVSSDDVTRYGTTIHAWTRADALRYLTQLRKLCETKDMPTDTSAPAPARKPAPIQPHTLGHRLLWLVSIPEVGPRQLAGYCIACMPDCHPGNVEAALTELVKRDLLSLSGLVYHLTDSGRAEAARLGVFTHA